MISLKFYWYLHETKLELLNTLAISGSREIIRFFVSARSSLRALILSRTHTSKGPPITVYAILMIHYFGSLTISIYSGKCFIKVKLDWNSSRIFAIESPSYYGTFKCVISSHLMNFFLPLIKSFKKSTKNKSNNANIYLQIVKFSILGR